MNGYSPTAFSGMDVNILPARNVYPGYDGGTLGTVGSASSPDALMYDSDPATGDTTAAVDTPAVSAGGTGALNWWVGLAILVALMLFAARKAGEASEFSNIRASTYNVSLITFIAVLGITLLKIIAVRVQNVPGLSGFSTIVKAV